MSRPRDRGLDTIYRSYYPTVTGGAILGSPATRGTFIINSPFTSGKSHNLINDCKYMPTTKMILCQLIGH